jgi:hypothetical protein
MVSNIIRRSAAVLGVPPVFEDSAKPVLVSR